VKCFHIIKRGQGDQAEARSFVHLKPGLTSALICIFFYF
jgi:hypothetical protein